MYPVAVNLMLKPNIVYSKSSLFTTKSHPEPGHSVLMYQKIY
jgi:hypothetical protein